MKYKLTILLFVLTLSHFTYCKTQVKTIKHRLFIYYGGSGFTNLAGHSNAEFYCSSHKFGLGAGYEINYPLSKKFEIHVSSGFSYFRSNYYYFDTTAKYVGGYKGNMDYLNLYLTPELSFKMNKRWQLNCGISNNFLLYNSLANDEIGQKVSWNNSRNNSRMKANYLMYSLGILFNFSKKISAKISYQRSFNPVITTSVFYKTNSPFTQYNHWQETEYITLYYKLK